MVFQEGPRSIMVDLPNFYSDSSLVSFSGLLDWPRLTKAPARVLIDVSHYVASVLDWELQQV